MDRPRLLQQLGSRLLLWTAKHFSLADDKADDETIDQSVRAGVEMRGTNLWVLIFAIFVASVGLNVNSPAVIIGAMLISPLMGPIMGVGYGVGVHDFPLIRAGLKHLTIAVILSLLTSTLYFLVSPLNAAQSELLARTSPTIWDVLIALFGGLAGMVAATRKEKSNVLPGVAIATALMPPLCTAGFALANGKWAYFLGAFYLFTINSVFIAVASAVIIRVLRVQEIRIVDPVTAARVGRYVLAIVLLTVLPAVYLAYQLVQTELFRSRAQSFVSRELGSSSTYVVDMQIDPRARTIDVTLVGAFVPKERLAAAAGHLGDAGLPDAKLQVHQSDQPHVDFSSLKAGVLSDLYAESQRAIEAKNRQIRILQDTLNAGQQKQDRIQGMPAELHAFFPQISEAWLAEALHWKFVPGPDALPVTVLTVQATRPIKQAERVRIEKWMAARLGSERVKLVVETSPVSMANRPSHR
jgi:uncharacterized hydrophobic protein (TIGR00271 family)